MCTLIALWHVVDGFDIVVGMNRDESLARPSGPPAFLDEDPPIVAPRDTKAGGTWIGANGKGLFAALSNRRGSVSPTARSRGLLTLETLRQPSVRAVDVFLQREGQTHVYNPWNLVAADREELRFFRSGRDVGMARGHEGINILTNEGGNVVTDPKVLTAQNLLAKASSTSVSDAIRSLQSALRTHYSGSDGASLCVHSAGGGNGTVSSTILALSITDPGENILLYADGAPCSNPFRDYHEVIRRLPGPD